MPTSGKCGENNTWKLNADGTLTISGTGDMDFGASGSPWESNIKKVVIENGVTNMGESAFYGCENLTDITTSDSVTRIDDGAFSKELTNKDKLTTGKIYTAKFTLAPFESHMFTEDTKVTLNGVEAKPTSDDFCREVE